MSFKVIDKKSLPSIPKSVIASVISKFQQGNQAGIAVGESNTELSVMNSSVVQEERKTNDLRVISPRFFPALGGKTATRALSQSLERLYNAVAGSAYDTVSFNRADLGKHLFITEGFVLAMDMIDRYLDTFAIRQYGNLAPDMLLSAQRFSKYHNGNLVDYPTLQAIRNELVPLFDKLLIPSSIGWLNKHRSLVRHVFADDVHEKTQFIVPIPEFIYAQIDSADNIDIMSASYWRPEAYITNMDIIDFAQGLVTYVQNYLDSAWFKDLSPYLWRAMCQENGPHIDKPVKFDRRDEVMPNLDLDVIFDYNVIQLIRNADYIGVPMNLRTNSINTNWGGVKIYEDNEGNLRQGSYAYDNTNGTWDLVVAPIATFYLTNHSITSAESAANIGTKQLLADANIQCALYPTNPNFKYVNAEDFPSSEETLYYLTNASVRTGAQKVGTNPGELRQILSCGDTIFTLINLYFNYLPYGGISAEEFMPYEFSCMYRLNQNSILNYSLSPLCISYNTNNITKEDIVALIESLNCCPLIGLVYADQNNNLATKVKYVDKDNLVHIPYDGLRFAHEFIMYNAMELGSSASTDTNESKGGKKRSKNKNRKDKKSAKQEEKKAGRDE